jgi:hypothetical protein
VEGRGVVEGGGAEGEEVFGGFGDGFAEYFKFYGAFCCVQPRCVSKESEDMWDMGL